MVLAASLPLALLVLSSTASASPLQADQQQQQPEASTSTSTNKQAFRYALAKRSRTFADANGMFDVSAFQKEKEMVAQKYAHSNAKYRRNLELGKVKLRRRSAQQLEPVYDYARRDYIGEASSSSSPHIHSKRQSSSGAVELTDCRSLCCPNSRERRGLAADNGAN